MPFKYRLQKFLEIRIRKKEEQLRRVVEAQNKVDEIILLIEKNKQKIKQSREDMRKSDPQTYESFDRYIKTLYENEEKLKIELEKAEEQLRHEKELLMEREKEVNVLEKHKENKKEEYFKEERAAELKMLNEIGSQKHFAKMKEEKEENGD